MLKADTLSVSTRWNFVTDAVLMDGQRKDATHSTIWLMPRPLLMNYAKLCPREWSHMFIMKAAGVLEIPWVAPNELHVTGRRDTQHGAMEGGGGRKKKTQPTLDLIGCIHQATWSSDGVFSLSLRLTVLSERRSRCWLGLKRRETALMDVDSPQRRLTPGAELKHGRHFVAKCLQLQPVYPNHH